MGLRAGLSAPYVRAGAWPYEHVILRSGEDDDDPDCEVILHLATSSVQVSVRLGGPALADVADRLVSLAGRWFTHWSRALPDTMDLRSCGLAPWDADYLRPRPPRGSSGRSASCAS